MRALLIYPQAANELIGYGDLGAVAEPLALEYLGAGAGEDGHEVRILDLRLHPHCLESELREFAPDVVGVTSYSMHVLRALKLCRECKRLRPECRTVVGGHHATLLPEDFFEPEVDFVVCGEGVHPFRTLLRALERRGDGGGIPGVWMRTADGFQSGGPATAFTIEELPRPDRSLTAPDRHSYFIDWMKPIALVRTSVGCPFRCNFCSLWKIMDGHYHIREVEGVMAEIASVQEECVFLVDDEAFIHGKRMAKLAELIAAEGIRKRYFAYCRIDSLLRQRDLMEQWRRIGLERLFIGIEAPSEQGLQEYNKKIALAAVEEGLRTAREIGIQVFGGFVVNTNYTVEDFKRLTRFVEHQRVDYPSFTVLTPLPGTEFLQSFDHILERQPNGRPNWELFDLQHPVTRTRLPADEFRRRYRALYKLFSEKYAEHRDKVRLRDRSGAIVA